MNAKRQVPGRWWGTAVVLVGSLALLLGSCSNHTVSTDTALPPPAPNGPPYLEDVTRGSGLDHSYRNGEEVNHLAILESLGGGAALLDYDGDGLLDVFLTGGGYYDGPNKRDIKGYPCKFYKNLGGLKFKDLTKEVGLDTIDFYTHGGAVADYDRDGRPDLLVTGWGRLALYHNEGGRGFKDITRQAKLTDDSWSTSAGWADFDGDGEVDLYVCHYVDWSFKKHPKCQYDGKTDDVCPPKNFFPLPHLVYRNNGDGTFTDVSKSAGLRVPREEADYAQLEKDLKDEALAAGRFKAQVPGRIAANTLRQLLHLRPEDRLPEKIDPDVKEAAEKVARNATPEMVSQAERELVEEMVKETIDRLRKADAPRLEGKETGYGKGLGVLLVDVNLDGKPDVYVANDTTDNFLYVNRSSKGKILFEETGLASGVARDDRGGPNGSMGVDAGDPFQTGRPAIWVTNYENEMHALYINECKGDRVIFRYGTQRSGIAAIGQAYVGWGTRFIDLDLDGLEDLLVSNGHAIRYPKGQAQRAQKPVLLLNQELPGGERRFKDVTPQGGSYAKAEHIGRGVGFGDLDNDGRIDLVLTPLNEPVALLRGVGGEGHHWLGVELKRKDNRSLVGTRVVLEAGGRTQTRFGKGGGSYLSANDERHVFGLGKGDKIDKVTVYWPGGGEQTWEGLKADRYWRLVEGVKEAQVPPYVK